MPKQVDHAARRTEIASAMWQTVARDGFEAATVRAVAVQGGISPGRVQHYFSTKDEMVRFALEQVGERFAVLLAERVAALGSSAAPRDVVRTVLVGRLPVDAEQRAYVQALLAWLGQAVRDRAVESSMVEGTRRLRDYVADRLPERADEGSTRRIAAGLLAMTDGLISHLLQGVLDHEAATAIIDEHLDLLYL